MLQENHAAELIAHLVFPVVMLDEPIHTDEHPYCDDPTCPCGGPEAEYQQALADYERALAAEPEWMRMLWTPIFHGSLYEPPIPAPVWCVDDDDQAEAISLCPTEAEMDAMYQHWLASNIII